MFNPFKKAPMNDLEKTAPVENPPGSGPAQDGTDPVADIARTMPAVELIGSGAGSAGTPAATPFSAPKRGTGQRGPDKAKRKPKGAARNPFAAPRPDEGEAPFDLEGAGSLPAEPMEPPVNPQVYLDYGVCLAGLQIGYYEAKERPVMERARKKLPADAVGELGDLLAVDERTKANLEKGLSALAETLSLPAGGATAFGYLKSSWDLHLMKMAGIQRILDRLDKMTDIEQPPAEPTRRNTL